MKHNLDSLTKSIKPLQEKLVNHEVYTKIHSPKDQTDNNELDH